MAALSTKVEARRRCVVDLSGPRREVFDAPIGVTFCYVFHRITPARAVIPPPIIDHCHPMTEIHTQKKESQASALSSSHMIQEDGRDVERTPERGKPPNAARHLFQRVLQRP
jgi:hypothetical protein